MDTRPSAVDSQNYHEIPDLCAKNTELVFPMKYDKDDLVIMDIETYNRREKMQKLREELLAVEDDRSQGRKGCTVDELDAYLDDIIIAEG